MSRNDKTSPRVSKLAATLLALSDYRLDVWINADPEKTRKTIRSLCASLVTQAPDKRKRKKPSARK